MESFNRDKPWRFRMIAAKIIILIALFIFAIGGFIITTKGD